MADTLTASNDIRDLRVQVRDDRYRVEVDRARGGSDYLHDTVTAEVAVMTDDEILGYAARAGFLACNGCGEEIDEDDYARGLCGDCAADEDDPCSGGCFFPSGYKNGRVCMNCETPRS